MLASATCTRLGLDISIPLEPIQTCEVDTMDIIERMSASQPAHLGWKPESAVEWGQRICSGVSSHVAQMGQQYQRLKSDLRCTSSAGIVQTAMAYAACSQPQCCLHFSSMAVPSVAATAVCGALLAYSCQKGVITGDTIPDHHASVSTSSSSA